MCVILDIPKDVPISKDILSLGYENNPDGFGLFFPTKNGKIHVHKIMPTKFDDVLKVWNLYKNYEAPKSIHFRLRTKGDKSKENVHPFRILSHAEHGREIWVMHNGTISDAPEIDKEKSDTWHFMNYILRPILAENPSLIEDKDFYALVEAMLKGDRMLLLDGKTGETIRLNPAKSGGHVTKEGIWVSNSYGLKEPYDYYGDGYGSGKSGVGTSYRGYKPIGTPKGTPSYNNIVFIGSTVKVFNEHKTVLEQRYDRGAELEIVREITDFLKDGNRNEVDIGLRLTVKNTGLVTLNRVGVRTELKKAFNTDLFDNIRIVDYTVRGSLTPTTHFTAAYTYGNKQYQDILPPAMAGVIEIKLVAEWIGDKEGFKELSTIDMSGIWVEAGYSAGTTATIAFPEPKDWVYVDENGKEVRPPWEEGDELSLEDERLIAEAMDEDEWGELPAAAQRRASVDARRTVDAMTELDAEVWGKGTEYENDDDGIVYYNFNANPDWELDYSILKNLTDLELIEAVRESPENIANFLKEFLDAF